ncbi:hypothetical protein ABK040_004356 [Willaertia magna]
MTTPSIQQYPTIIEEPITNNNDKINTPYNQNNNAEELIVEEDTPQIDHIYVPPSEAKTLTKEVSERGASLDLSDEERNVNIPDKEKNRILGLLTKGASRLTSSKFKYLPTYEVISKCFGNNESMTNTQILLKPFNTCMRYMFNIHTPHNYTFRTKTDRVGYILTVPIYKNKETKSKDGHHDNNKQQGLLKGWKERRKFGEKILEEKERMPADIEGDLNEREMQEKQELKEEAKIQKEHGLHQGTVQEIEENLGNDWEEDEQRKVQYERHSLGEEREKYGTAGASSTLEPALSQETPGKGLGIGIGRMHIHSEVFLEELVSVDTIEKDKKVEQIQASTQLLFIINGYYARYRRSKFQVHDSCGNYVGKIKSVFSWKYKCKKVKVYDSFKKLRFNIVSYDGSRAFTIIDRSKDKRKVDKENYAKELKNIKSTFGIIIKDSCFFKNQFIAPYENILTQLNGPCGAYDHALLFIASFVIDCKYYYDCHTYSQNSLVME